MSINETDSTIIENKVRISTALNLLRGVLPDEAYGINKEDLQKITILLAHAEEKLFKMLIDD